MKFWPANEGDIDCIRPLQAGDIDAVCSIVNDNWKRVYSGYINPELLTEQGCAERSGQLKADFASGRLREYVWEEYGTILALLSIGSTADEDKRGAFEVWRIYVSKEAQGKGIGKTLLTFAEQQARTGHFHEIVIWAFKENAHAVLFYEKHGYVIEKEEYLGMPYLAHGIRLSKKI